MNILITGSCGYLGSILVEELFNAFPSSKIVSYDNLLYNQDGLIPFCKKDNFKFVFGDVRNENLLMKYVNESDVIVPLAAIVGAPACDLDPQLAEDVNYGHVKFIVDNKRDDQFILLPQTNSGYGVGSGDKFCTEETALSPISVYGKTKCNAEKEVLNCGGISLRLATLFGTSYRMRLDLLVNDFVYKSVTDGYIVLFEKDFKRNFIHVRDVANAFIHMIVNYKLYSGQAFNVGLSSANISKLELANKIKEFVPKFSIQTDDIATDPDKRNYIVSNEKIEKTGWQPKYTLEMGIKELISAYEIMKNIPKKYSNV